MCDATLAGLGRLTCTLTAPHPGHGHRFESVDVMDGHHDDNQEDDR